MRKVALLILLICSHGFAFAHNGNSCAQKKHKTAAKTTLATPEENEYDVIYTHFDISLTNTSTEVSGNVSTRSKVLATSMPVYAFELSSDIILDSVKIDNQLLPALSAGSIRRVTLTSPLPQGSIFTAQVFYHGQPPNGSGFFTRGLNNVNVAGGVPITYTMSDPYTAQDWWPCKQSIQDKIDSADIWVTVDNALKAGSNGLLKNITPMPGGKQRFEWKTKYPIDYYLISIAVGKYGDYHYNMNFTDGTGDVMPIHNYVYDSLNYMTPARKAAFDTTGLIVDHFSKLFGKYPFYKEKYGHCMAEPLGGGMEHQTMTTLAYATPTLIAHELGHQWWGNHVTYSTWADIWLSEGFATYTEQLFVEHFHGIDAAKKYRTQSFNEALTATTGSVYVNDTNDVYRVFDGDLTYNKGAAVVHMLRYLAPNDNLFFDVLKTYQQQYAFGLASTADLQDIAEQAYGKGLDTFFTQWVYGEGHPTYSAKWYQMGTTLYIIVEQATSVPGSVAYFNMPIDIKLKSPDGDTTFRAYNNGWWQPYQIQTSKNITGMEIDPDNHVLNKTGAIKNDISAAVNNDIAVSGIFVYPNPATDGWHVKGLTHAKALTLTDMSGKVISNIQAAKTEIFIPSDHLASGIYMLLVKGNDDATYQYKLVK